MQLLVQGCVRPWPLVSLGVFLLSATMTSTSSHGWSGGLEPNWSHLSHCDLGQLPNARMLSQEVIEAGIGYMWPGGGQCGSMPTLRLRGGRAGKKRQRQREAQQNKELAEAGREMVSHKPAEGTEREETRAHADENDEMSMVQVGEAGRNARKDAGRPQASAKSDDDHRDAEERKRRKMEKRRLYEEGRRAFIKKAEWSLRKARWVQSQMREDHAMATRSIRVSIELGMKVLKSLPKAARERDFLPPILVPRSVLLARAGWIYNGGRSIWGIGCGWQAFAWAPKGHPVGTGRISVPPSQGMPRKYAVWLCPAMDRASMFLESIAAAVADEASGGTPVHIGVLPLVVTGEPLRVLEDAGAALKGLGGGVWVGAPEGRVRAEGVMGGGAMLWMKAEPAGFLTRARAAVSNAVSGYAQVGATPGGEPPRLELGYTSKGRDFISSLQDRMSSALPTLGRGGNAGTGGGLLWDRVSVFCVEGPPRDWYSVGCMALSPPGQVEGESRRAGAVH